MQISVGFYSLAVGVEVNKRPVISLNAICEFTNVCSWLETLGGR